MLAGKGDMGSKGMPAGLSGQPKSRVPILKEVPSNGGRAQHPAIGRRAVSAGLVLAFWHFDIGDVPAGP